MAEEIKVGDQVPPFFLKDNEGYHVTDEDVVGNPLVIYFYPKDDTPGCTKEACAFRDCMDQFDQLQTLVIGVSPDGVDSHKKFVEKNQLNFTLLCDEKKDMARLFGVLDKDDHIIRATFVVDSKGIVKWIEKLVEVSGHVDRVCEALKEHCPPVLVKYGDDEGDYEEFLEEMNREKKEKK